MKLDMENSEDKFQEPVLLENYKTFNDARGSFKVFNHIGVPGEVDPYDLNWSGWFYQTNISISHPGVLRGMHWQKSFPQGKLVRVIYGSVLDVVVDIRPKSPNFKRVYSFRLTENGEQLFVPRGFAHGFYNDGNVDAAFYYNIDNVYSPKNERGLRWDSIDFEWPIPAGKQPILSSKDQVLPKLDDIPIEDLELV